MKKIFSTAFMVFLSTFIFYTINASAETEGIYTYYVSYGEATITDCDNSASGEITIPSSFGGYPITTIGDDAFSYCYSLTSVTIPNGVTSIGNYAFVGCYSLTSVTIPNGVTTIGNHAFSTCNSLTSVTIPDSITTIGDDAFGSCSSLKSVTISNNVTIIPVGAFSDCGSLTSVTIPNSVTSIVDDAFWNCGNLADVYYSGTEGEWNDITIGYYNSYLKNATIHYNYVPNTIAYNAENKTIELTSYDTISGKVIVATYNDNRLLNATIYDASQMISNIEIDTNNATTAKIFWWNSLEYLVPQCDALEIPL